MIVPAEADGAYDALRNAQTAIGDAIDACITQNTGLHDLIDTLRQAHDATSWCVEHVHDAIRTQAARARVRLHMEAVEERHVECQTFPWVEEL